MASGQVVTAMCSIGDENVTFTYADGTQTGGNGGGNPPSGELEG